MAQIATNIEQSKELLKAGIPADTADMHYNGYALNNEAHHPLRNGKCCGEYDVPAWSLSALWNLSKFPLVFTTQEDTPEKIIELLVNDLTLPF